MGSGPNHGGSHVFNERWAAVLELLASMAVTTRLYKEMEMPRRKRKVTLTLPDEFIDLCEADLQKPEVVLRGFIADLAGIVSWCSNPRADRYASNGSDERRMAEDYYNRVGYPYMAEIIRQQQQKKNLPKSQGSQAANLNCRDRQKDLARHEESSS